MSDYPTSSDEAFDLYLGDGTVLSDRGRTLPPFDPGDEDRDPANYIAGSSLRDAVNVALMLGQPLLVAGEPGTGKTQLAGSIAHELGLLLLTFNTKSTSTARDLFYRYDALRHFHDAHFRKDPIAIEEYIVFEALGLAILLTKPHRKETDRYLLSRYQGKAPCRSVILIDEIDKAPRDVLNDVLNEIEQASFILKENGESFEADTALRPIVVFTSNSEKSLPDAFLRRCIYYYISFPDSKRLKQIVRKRLKLSHVLTPRLLDLAVHRFEAIRSLPLRKKPATAELLAWVDVLLKKRIALEDLETGGSEALLSTYCILAKGREDRELIERSRLPLKAPTTLEIMGDGNGDTDLSTSSAPRLEPSTTASLPETSSTADHRAGTIARVDP